MALIVEDGSNVANAESYATVAYADSYQAARGNTNWATLTTDEKEQALRRGTDYMEQVYKLRWAGSRVVTTQALSWPRIWVPIHDFSNGSYPAYLPDDAVPASVVKACAELALKAAAGELLADEERAVSSETVGPLAVVYDSYSPQTKRYKAIEAMLSALLTGGIGSVSVVRT